MKNPLRAVLRCDLAWDPALLDLHIAGLTLLERHVLAFRAAGITEIELRQGALSPSAARAQASREASVGVGPHEPIEGALSPSAARAQASREASVGVGPQRLECNDGALSPFGERAGAPSPRVTMPNELKADGRPPADAPDAWIEQRADTLIDPRVLLRVLEEGRQGGKAVICVDRHRANYSAEEKSPYRIGAADDRDVRLVSLAPGFEPIGLALEREESAELFHLDVGRHYWHRITCADDAREATRKIFFSTMKPTDGVYARTNRRFSIPISIRLSDTRVTPNMVSVFTLILSALSGALFAFGGYMWSLAGGIVSWLACMLDGVDGELARAKFQATDFGAWLEMVGDYLYYVFVFAGMSLGLYRRTHHAVWVFLGVGAIAGVILSFTLVAALKRKFRPEAGAAGFYLSFQRKLAARASNPFYGFLRRVNFLATRAAVPYYFFLFALLHAIPLLFVIVSVGVHVGWGLAAYALFLPTGTEPRVEAGATSPEPSFPGEALSRAVEDP